jgi:hypothetical protein
VADTSLDPLAAVKDYLGERASGWSDTQLANALASETSAQAAVVKAKALGKPDVVDALFRRVDCNLAMQAIPLGVQQSGDGFNTIGSNDPLVRRLEKPYRKVVSG